jgi:hypothetical protein
MKNRIDCKAVEVNSLPLEQKPYFSNDFAMSSKFITNRGCIRINSRNIDIVQNREIRYLYILQISYMLSVTYTCICTNCYADFNKIESDYNKQ